MNTSSDTPLKISIVTPNYNGEAYLQQALDSVLDQHYPALQYVAVDGESTDNSKLILESYRPRLSNLIIEPDEGHADALNKGFAVCDGDVMGWINSDDVLHPNCLFLIDRIFRMFPEVEWVTGRSSSMTADGELDYIGPLKPWSRLRYLAGDYRWIQQESTFWRRSLWERVGGRLDTDFDLANDFDLWSRFFRHAPLYSADFMLGCFRFRPGQRSADFRDAYEAEMEAIFERELAAAPEGFASIYPNLIAKTGKPLSEEKIARMGERLRDMDPPPITATALRTGKLESGGLRFGTGLMSPEPTSDLTVFANKHKGERCFIVGNGPSLNETDLSLLEGEVVFGCNSIFLLFDRIKWRPTYYACVDSRVLPDRADDIGRMLDANPDMMGFFPSEIVAHGGERHRSAVRSMVGTDKNRFFFNETPGTLAQLPWSMFSDDVNNQVVQPHTVAITMLQLAQYMGFSEIYLIGCDMRYTIPDQVEREDAHDPNDSRLTSTVDNDSNHFDPTYFGANRQWHVPNVALMQQHFELARQALVEKGVTIKNATVGGDLEVYDRVGFTSLFPRGKVAARSPEIRPTVPEGPLADAPSKSPDAGTDTPPEASRFGALQAVAARNAAFFVAAGVGFAAGLAAFLLVPESRIWIAVAAIGAGAFIGIAALAIKTRRILRQISEAVRDLQKKRTQTELDLHRERSGLTLKLQHLDMSLHGLEVEIDDIKRKKFRSSDRE